MELLEAREWPVFTDLANAQASVADYFGYCNHKRRHSNTGQFKHYAIYNQNFTDVT